MAPSPRLGQGRREVLCKVEQGPRLHKMQSRASVCDVCDCGLGSRELPGNWGLSFGGSGFRPEISESRRVRF